MNYSISNTAEWGEYVSGPRIITAETKAEMKRILKDIQTGKFASEWMQEYRSGLARFKGIRRQNDGHQIEQVGEKLRGMMPWIAKNVGQGEELSWRLAGGHAPSPLIADVGDWSQPPRVRHPLGLT